MGKSFMDRILPIEYRPLIFWRIGSTFQVDKSQRSIIGEGAPPQAPTLSNSKILAIAGGTHETYPRSTPLGTVSSGVHDVAKI